MEYLMTVRSLVVLLASLALAPVAAAEPYPTRTITVVVPYPAGGPTDALGRLVGERMSKALGQSVVIDNASGAGGTVGSAKVVRAPADGYTICVGQLNSHVFGPAVYNTPYDVQGDFEPVGMISISALMLAGRADLPANTLAELVVWLKARPQPAPFATIGPGSPPHVWSVAFAKQTGARFQPVPYRGAAPAIQDMLGGRIDLTVLDASSLMPHVQAGKLKGYAVLNDKRFPIAPDVPTMTEAGFPGYEMPFWTGLFVRKGTPAEAVARLSAALVESLADPALAKRITDLGQDLPTAAERTPQGLGARHRADIEKWWPLIKAANIKAE
jgi:tripartite-type tricarboxylate transporter receptor subunit TctC